MNQDSNSSQVMNAKTEGAAQSAMAQAVPSGLRDSLNAIRKGYAAEFLSQPDIKCVLRGFVALLVLLDPAPGTGPHPQTQLGSKPHSTAT